MPDLLNPATEDIISLDELISRLDEGFDLRDEGAFRELATPLKQLANNRVFLADFAIREMKEGMRSQERDNPYGTQVIFLHLGRNYLLRANFWPAATDEILQVNGSAPFFYHLAHDHNFNFLTVGYHGPGYWSDYYQYDPETVVGVVGEAVDLRFVSRECLSPGSVMFYRAHRDVHVQFPADSLSVSLNIVEATPHSMFADQYRFDLHASRISEVLTHTSLDALLPIVAELGGGNGEDLLADFSKAHPSPRIRLAALRARAGAAADQVVAASIIAEGLASDSEFVRRSCTRLLNEEPRIA